MFTISKDEKKVLINSILLILVSWVVYKIFGKERDIIEGQFAHQSHDSSSPSPSPSPSTSCSGSVYQPPQQEQYKANGAGGRIAYVSKFEGYLEAFIDGQPRWLSFLDPCTVYGAIKASGNRGPWLSGRLDARNGQWYRDTNRRYNALSGKRYWGIWSDKKEMKVRLSNGKYLEAYIYGKWHYLSWTSGYNNTCKYSADAKCVCFQNGAGAIPITMTSRCQQYRGDSARCIKWGKRYLAWGKPKSAARPLSLEGTKKDGYAAIWHDDDRKAMPIYRVGPCQVEHTCPKNGTPAYENCWSNPHNKRRIYRFPSCGNCYTGYHLAVKLRPDLTAERRCVLNTCNCPHGTQKTGSQCPNHNASLCATCDSGFKLSSDNTTCLKTCGSGFKLSSDKTTCLKTCGSGFKLSSDKTKCNPHVCVCPGGTPTKDLECPNHNVYHCSKCDTNYKYNSSTNACQPKKTDAIISYWKKPEPTEFTSFRLDSKNHSHITKHPNVNPFYFPRVSIHDIICEKGVVPLEDYNWKYTSGQQDGCKHKGICTYYNKSAYSSNIKPSGNGEAVLEPVPENAHTCIKEDGTRDAGCQICGV